MMKTISAGSSKLQLRTELKQPKSISHRTGNVSIHCMSKPSDETTTSSQSNRRDALYQITLTVLTATTTTTHSQPALAMPPGFKKDLKSTRKAQIPEEDYKPGPEGLKYYDIVVGTGAEAQVGSRVAAHLDVKWRGITFFSSRQGMGVTGGTPMGFDVGAKVGLGGTLKGLDLAIRGMRVGGQRRCIVPPELAYGSKGYGEIPPNATIMFDIALLSIKQNAIGTKVKLVEG